MSYIHNGKEPVELRNDPMGIGSEEWIYFSLGGFLRTGETVSEHSADVVGGNKIVDSTYLGSISSPDGTVFTEVYGVKIGTEENSNKIRVTLTFSTTVTGDVDTGRKDVPRTAIISVRAL